MVVPDEALTPGNPPLEKDRHFPDAVGADEVITIQAGICLLTAS